MNAALIMIGTELLDGGQRDANGPWLCAELTRAGWNVACLLMIPDEAGQVARALDCLEDGVELVVLSGGLGPTIDDRTRFDLAEWAGVDLAEVAEEVVRIRTLIEARGRAWVESNRVQALFPVGSLRLENVRGTASGIWLERQGKIVVALPGVPSELRGLFAEEVLPLLRKPAAVRLEQRLLYSGVGESAMASLMSGIAFAAPWKFASLPTHEGVELRVSLGEVRDRPEGERVLSAKVDELLGALAPLRASLVCRGEGGLPEQVVSLLRLAAWRLAVAESCTGGGVGALITRVVGCSDVFAGGVISYSNEIKTALLGVEASLLREKGAVSAEVVAEMARGVLRQSGAECAIAISGVAGPGGGTEEKPVGLVWLAASTPSREVVESRRFAGDREEVRQRAAFAALDLLRRLLQ